MAAPEFAAHIHDLETALGSAAAALDPELAEEGREPSCPRMTDEMRGNEFGTEQAAPADADATIVK